MALARGGPAAARRGGRIEELSQQTLGSDHKEDTMRFRIGALAALVLVSPLRAQDAPPTPPVPRLQGGPSTAATAKGAPQVPQVIYQLDLVPTGHALVVGKPRQIGDAYFVVSWPDRQTV